MLCLLGMDRYGPPIWQSMRSTSHKILDMWCAYISLVARNSVHEGLLVSVCLVYTSATLSSPSVPSLYRVVYSIWSIALCRGRWMNCGCRLCCSAALVQDQVFLRQTDCAPSSRSAGWSCPTPTSLRLVLWGASRLLHLFISAHVLYMQGVISSVLDYFHSFCTRRRGVLLCLLALSLGFLHCSQVLSCTREKSCDCRFSMVTHKIHCHWLHMHFLTASWERFHASLHKEGGEWCRHSAPLLCNLLAGVVLIICQ